MDDARCGNCIYYDSDMEKCRRYPPNDAGHQPPTKAHYWCGEHTAIPEASDLPAGPPAKNGVREPLAAPEAPRAHDIDEVVLAARIMCTLVGDRPYTLTPLEFERATGYPFEVLAPILHRLQDGSMVYLRNGLYSTSVVAEGIVARGAGAQWSNTGDPDSC